MSLNVNFILRKYHIRFRFILVACVVCSALAQDEERPPAPSRGLLKRGSLAKGKATTTTTTAAPQVLYALLCYDTL